MTQETKSAVTAIARTLGDLVPHENWPEDEWVGLSPSLDANIYTDSMNAKRITVFHVEDGKTDTSRAVEIYTSDH